VYKASLSLIQGKLFRIFTISLISQIVLLRLISSSNFQYSNFDIPKKSDNPNSHA
jgi:hypothetical protein